MLTITLDVNGREIGKIGVHNKGEVYPKDDDSWCRYGVYDLGEASYAESLEECEKIATIWHARDDGAAVLAEKAMAIVDEREILADE